jgi:matrix metalloproteinase-14 (membrane-inserted)
MGVSNVKALGTLDGGTARDLGLIATAPSQAHKRPHSAHAPLWMIRNIMNVPETFTTKHDKANEDAAKEIAKCAKRVTESPLPGKDDCTIRQFASRWKLAAVRWQGAQAYFFKGDRYSAFQAKPDRLTNASDPLHISTDWPESWEGGIDAAMLWGGNTAYFFKGPEYIKYDVKAKKKASTKYPLLIKDHWSGVWANGIDAAVPWNDGKVYFFKGAEYIQYDVKGDKADPGYPKPIKGNWPDLWENGIDAGMCWDGEDAYFFKDLEYIKYNVKTKKAYPGFPKPINGTWSHVKWEKG